MQEDRLMFSQCTIINQGLFFVENQDGLPAKMNPDNGDILYYSAMENFVLKSGDIIYDIRTLGDRVYALEASGERIIIFDLKKSQCQYIPLKCAYRQWGNFVAFEQYGLYLYIFPRYENKIYIMNTTNNKISEVTDYFDGITELQCACRVADKVWLLPHDAEVIGCYDLVNGKIQIYEMKRKIENCVHAVFVNGSIYILNRFGIIYVWNMHELKLDEVKRLETEYSDEKSIYIKMVYAGNKLIILPSLEGEIKILDLLTDSIETYHDYPEDFLYYDITGRPKYGGVCEDANYFYCAMRKENYLLKISKQDGALSWIKPRVPSKEERMKILLPLKEKRFKDACAAGESIFLEKDINVSRFLKEVPRKKYIAKRANAGEVIFEEVRK